MGKQPSVSVSAGPFLSLMQLFLHNNCSLFESGFLLTRGLPVCLKAWELPGRSPVPGQCSIAHSVHHALLCPAGLSAPPYSGCPRGLAIHGSMPQAGKLICSPTSFSCLPSPLCCLTSHCLCLAASHIHTPRRDNVLGQSSPTSGRSITIRQVTPVVTSPLLVTGHTGSFSSTETCGCGKCWWTPRLLQHIASWAQVHRAPQLRGHRTLRTRGQCQSLSHWRLSAVGARFLLSGC